jgi:hypothetical protein
MDQLINWRMKPPSLGAVRSAAPTIIQSAVTLHRVGAFLFHAALRERKQAD